MVADGERRDALSHCLDDARPLVAEHGRRRPHPLALDRVQIGAADPDRGHADEHLTGPGLLQVELANLERPPRLEEDGRARLHPSASTTSPELVTVETFCSA